MEAIIFVGIQASGKSTYYKNNLFNTHLRISNDLLKTKNREKLLLEFCKYTNMPFVVDNTNFSKEIRRHYLNFCKEIEFSVKCYYFKTDLQRSILWNSKRIGNDRIPDVGILGTHKKMEIPTVEEGFHELFYVDFVDGNFVLMDWKNEI